jgi:hypothetical protein
MFAAGKTAASGEPPDLQFNLVTMLLHGDGTNGSQNKTFVDSSENNTTITANGDVSQGSFTPLGNNWGVFFNGTSDNIGFSRTTNLDLGSGDFTIECWFFHLTGTGNGVIWSQWNNGGDNTSQLLTNGTGLIYRIYGNQWSFGTFVANTWNHVAISRQSGTVRMFLNGALVRSETDTSNITTTSSTVIGANDTAVGGANFFQGYISNFRQVKGTALYTSAFTPSTSPLTAVSGTQLLVCASHTFEDKSSNNYTNYVTSYPKIDKFNPFGTDVAYSAAVHGASISIPPYQYLTTPANYAGVQLGSSDFTLEFWIYTPNNGGDADDLVGYTNVGGGSRSYGIYINGTEYRYYLASDAGVFRLHGSMGGGYPNAWNHIALTRSGSTFYSFVNGKLGQTTSSTEALRTLPATWHLGSSSNSVPRYFFNPRVIKGTCLYTANFTPPRSRLTAVTNTTLLLSGENGSIIDNAMNSIPSTIDNAQISTSIKKYGTGSLKFDGTGDYLWFPNTPTNTFSNGDFTIECWLYRNSDSGTICGKGFGLGGGFLIWVQSNQARIRVYNNDDPPAQFTLATGSILSLSTWVHLAFTKSGSVYTIYVDGVNQASTTGYTTDLNINRPFTIGGYLDPDTGSLALPLNGYIDDFRISKKVLYTSNFTPPTSAFSNKGPY